MPTSTLFFRMNKNRIHEGLRLLACHPLMGVLTLAGVLLADAASPVATNQFKDTISFSNGDRISGRLMLVQPDGWLGWAHVDAEQPVLFSTQNISQIDLDGRGGDATTAATWKVRFDNEDELAVRQLAISADRIELESWYLGKTSVPRNRVRSMTPVQTNFALVFEGPRGTNGWTSWKVVSALGEPGEWKYQDRSFYAREAASIARMLGLPDSFTMEFDLKWKGPLNVAIALFTDSLKPISLANKEDEPDFAGFYSLQINSFGANLLSVKKRDPLRYLGQQSVPGLASKTKAHVEIKVDKRSRRILLFIDGVLAKQWTEPSEFSGEGRGIRLVHQGQGGVRLSQLKIAEWDGRYDDRIPSNAVPAKGDVVLMLDGERLTGQIRALESGNILLSTEAGEVRKAVNQVRAIELRSIPPAAVAKPQTDPSSKPATEVQIHFQRHGRLTLKLDQIQGQKMTGTSSVSGPVELDTTAISRLVFPSK